MTHRSHRLRVGLALLTALTLPAPALAGVADAAAPRPDLRVASVTAPSTMTPGARLGVRTVVANPTPVRATATRTRFHLSRDRRADKRDVVLGTVATKALAPRSRRTLTLTARVPAAVAAGRWYVVACADASRQVRERKEVDNCRASAAVTVRATPLPPPPPGATFPMPPDPVTTGAAQLETARAVRKTAFPFIDNTITATAADGTTYTLEIPREALLQTIDITLTPVSSVAGFPMSGGLRAAVQLEPHGLLLQEPARLTIDSPDLGPLDDQTGFLFHEGGEDFHAYPPAMPVAGDDPSVMRMTLTHFSTPGVGSGTAPGVPVRSLGQLEAAVSGLLARERAAQLGGSEPDPAVWQQVHSLMRSYYDTVLRQQLIDAETDPERAPQATSEALGWMRQMQLTGVTDDPRFDEAWLRIERIWRNALTFFWNRCVAANDIASAPVLLGIARSATLLGFSWAQDAADKALRCANVEVRFSSALDAESHLVGTVGGGGGPGDGGIDSMDSEGSFGLAATIAVPSRGSGEGVLDYTSFSHTSSVVYTPGSSCQLVSTTTGTGTSPGKMLALLTLDSNPREIPPGEVTTPHSGVLLSLYPGYATTGGSVQPTETYTHRNSGCSTSSSTSTASGWLGSYREVHGHADPRWDGTKLQLTVRPEDRSGDVLLDRTWTVSKSTTSPTSLTTDTTTVRIVHKPLT